MNNQNLQRKLSAYIPIKWRVQSISDRVASLVCYIDARDNMKRLDEVFGVGGWQRDQKEIAGVVYGGVGVLVDGEWVWKWDAGTESNTEEEKGQSSDAFKRACVNFGIGRFMYSLPIIKLPVANNNRKKPMPAKVAGDSNTILWGVEAVSKYINDNLEKLSKIPRKELDKLMNKEAHFLTERSEMMNAINAGLLHCQEPADFKILSKVINAAPSEVAQRFSNPFKQQMQTHKIEFNAKEKEYLKVS